MQPLSRTKYRAYKKEALKRGDNVYERNDAASIFKAAFYEADAAARKENVTYIITIAVIAGSMIVNVGLMASVLC